MAAECAFCPSTAKLSGEHIWSDWMNALFPGKKKYLNIIERTIWSSNALDWKAKVISEPCNNGWMSNIES
jgi:hypothetical protein